MAGKIALLILARVMAIDEEDDEIIFQELVKISPDISNLAQVLGFLQSISLAFGQYISSFVVFFVGSF